MFNHQSRMAFKQQTLHFANNYNNRAFQAFFVSRMLFLQLESSSFCCVSPSHLDHVSPRSSTLDLLQMQCLPLPLSAAIGHPFFRLLSMDLPFLWACPPSPSPLCPFILASHLHLMGKIVAEIFDNFQRHCSQIASDCFAGGSVSVLRTPSLPLPPLCVYVCNNKGCLSSCKVLKPQKRGFF